MKKTVYLLLMMVFILGACSPDNKNEPELPVEEEPEPVEKESKLIYSDFPDFESYYEAWVNKYFGNLDWDLTPYLNVCDAVTDAVILDLPKGWHIGADIWIIDDDTVHSMSTCGLLETMILHEGTFMGGFPFSSPASSYRGNPGVADFNSKLRTNKVAVEFFKREDCVSVLASRYLSFIAAMIDENYRYVNWMLSLEMLVSSDMYMSVLSKKEKILFMAMGLEITKYSEHLLGTMHIMIAVMKICNYTPFMEEVWPKLMDRSKGYIFDPLGGNLVSTGITSAQAGIIIHYANQFYKQIKTEIL